MALFKEELRSIRAFVFDVDGVLAESQVLLHPSGDMMRSMNTKDGFAMLHAVRQGFPTAIISGARSESIIERFESIGISDVFLDSHNKLEHLKIFIAKYGLDPSSVLYMGDDLPDIEAMKFVGLAVCPHDAAEEVQSISKYISSLSGGKGCVRDIVEQVLRAQGKWFSKD